MADRVRDLEKAKDAYTERNSSGSIAAHRLKSAVRNGFPSGLDFSDGAEEAHSDAGPYLKSMVFGGLDGTVTTFTLVCASVGGGLSTSTLIVLGIAKVLGDAVSMGLGDAVSDMAEFSFVTSERNREQWEMQNYLEGEIDEMVELYVKKGFKEGDAREILQLMVEKNPDFFLDHMLVQELGLMPPDEDESPMKKGIVMFTSFAVCGIMVLGPFVVFAEEAGSMKGSRVAYTMSILITMLVLASLGWVKASFTNQSKMKSALQYVVIGGLSASVAFLISRVTSRV
eukprot:g793.t1